MKMQKSKTIACVLVVALALSIASAQPKLIQTQALAQTAEAGTVGGMSCARVWGFGLAMGLAAAFSPCGVLCGTAAWYDLLLLFSCS